MGMRVAKGDDAQLARLNARLLVHLAHRRLAQILATVDMTTGQLPLARQGEALLDEEHLIAFNNESTDPFLLLIVK